VFFNVIADTIRELLGADWTPAIDKAWRELLKELDRYVNDAIQTLQVAD
jgi:hypothetical protein